jgi:phospholipid:diacylglycerol acyltransferase
LFSSLSEELDLKVHFPVVIIPGISASIMESWSTEGKSKKFFRKHVWGTLDMIRVIFTDKSTWKEVMKLDKKTGLDPENIKIRPIDGTCNHYSHYHKTKADCFLFQ